jgi:UDP-glucose 4-epimerase
MTKHRRLPTADSRPSTAGYRLSTILVTGGCGFLGTNLVKYLSGKGYKVRILDNLSAPSRKSFCQESAVNSPLSPQTVDSGLSTVDLVVGDIRDDRTVKKATEGVDAVVHLAAHTSVVESLEKPREAWDINVNGTLNLLETCRLNRADRFVFASSNAVVGEQEPPIDERKIPRPLSPYGASKLAGEALCSTYYHSFGLRTISLRFSNLYGPHSEHKPSVIAKYMDWARKGEPLVIYGDGNQTRDFVHVDDVCQAIHLALTADSRPATADTQATQRTQQTQQTLSTPETPLWGEVFQIASGVETSINQLVELIQSMVDGQLSVVRKPKRKGEIERNYSDIAKARRLLGFEPKIELREGLRQLWQAR